MNKSDNITVDGVEYYVEYLYEPYLAPLEDDPGASEYIEIWDIFLEGVSVLEDATYGLYDEIMNQLERNIHDRVSTKCTRYVDNDSLRPKVDEREQERLGFKLMEEYDEGGR